MFEINLIMFRQYLDMFIDACRLPDQYKTKADIQLNVVM